MACGHRCCGLYQYDAPGARHMFCCASAPAKLDPPTMPQPQTCDICRARWADYVKEHIAEDEYRRRPEVQAAREAESNMMYAALCGAVLRQDIAALAHERALAAPAVLRGSLGTREDATSSPTTTDTTLAATGAHSRAMMGRVKKELVHLAVDQRAESLTRLQNNVGNDIIHANDGIDPKIKFGRTNPFWNPDVDFTYEAAQALKKVSPHLAEQIDKICMRLRSRFVKDTAEIISLIVQ
eukprot:m.55923 g.55923  ORF g.55923 m.55923 type:complete len:239 (+) comp6724_c0_seq3:77-793(+)